MHALRPLKPYKLIKVLDGLGFVAVRKKGSHISFRHPDGRTTLVPVHSGEEIDRHLLNKIIKKDLGMEIDDFMKLV